jgi:hypothetical protein
VVTTNLATTVDGLAIRDTSDSDAETPDQSSVREQASQ